MHSVPVIANPDNSEKTQIKIKKSLKSGQEFTFTKGRIRLTIDTRRDGVSHHPIAKPRVLTTAAGGQIQFGKTLKR